MASDQFFLEPGEAASRLREMDWPVHPLGAPETWPPKLRVALGICLNARFPAAICWGLDATLFYNDAYMRLFDPAKHPFALARSLRESWPENWHATKELIDRAFALGARSSEQQLPWLLPENAQSRASFSVCPLLSDDGQRVEGFFCIGSETPTVSAQRRRLRTCRRLNRCAAAIRSIEDACYEAAVVLGENADDIPFGAIYVLDDARENLVRMATIGELSSQSAPAKVPLAGAHAAIGTLEYGIAEAYATGELRAIELLASASESAQRAIVLAIGDATGSSSLGVLVAGLGTLHSLDGASSDFFEFVSEQLGAIVANARAHEEERSRTRAQIQLGEARTAFYSDVSHEFRTPLTLILGTIGEVLARLEEPARSVLTPQLEIVRRNALRTLKLVNTLLDFAHVESGSAHARCEPVDLSALTIELASTFRSAIESAGIRFDVRCTLSEQVWVDRGMWDKIVLNLLSNAFKHTFQGRIEVQLDALGDDVVLVVADTGSGIPPDQLPRVFDRFYRVEGARARAYEGSGIGLAMVQELVRLHSGSVSLESAVDRGTRVTVRLPRFQARLADEADASRKVDLTPARLSRLDESIAEAFIAESQRWLASTGSEHNTSQSEHPPSFASAALRPDETVGARIVVVDDDADLRAYLVNLLSGRWTVQAFANAPSALAYVRAHQVELVLTDIMMPGVDGLSLLRALRSDPKLCTIPVILLSGRTGEDSRVEGLDAGADDYLIKPFSPREACARVEAQLRLAARAGLVEANRAKDEFLAVLSHELRTPLTPILLWGRALERGDVPLHDFGSAIAAINSCAERELHLVDELLELSRMITGSTSVDRGWSSLDDVVRRGVAAARSLALQAGIELHIAHDGELGSAYVDASRMAQVLSRLLENAIKFTPRGGRVALSVVAEDDAIVAEVTDTGQGLSAEFLQNAFEPFRQFSTGDARAHGGLGIGLALARHVLLLHGGTLEAKSEGQGRGAVFTARFPRNAATHVAGFSGAGPAAGAP